MFFAFNLMHDWRAMNVTLLLAPMYHGHSLSVQFHNCSLHAIKFLQLIQILSLKWSPVSGMFCKQEASFGATSL